MRPALLLSIFVSGCFFACAAPTDPEAPEAGDVSEEEIASAKKVFTAELREDPKLQGSRCDRVTTLSLFTSRRTTFVTLEDGLSAASTCKIKVLPNERRYTVFGKDDGCGSTVYRGRKSGTAIEVSDHRKRVCENVVPALLEVHETSESHVHSLYGAPLESPPPSAPKEVLAARLYGSPQSTPSPTCDHYRQLVIREEAGKLTATLKSQLSPTSVCELFVEPHEATYAVTAKDDACGSTIYTTTNGTDLRVQDNTKRLCLDLRVASIEVSEAGRALYSLP